MHYRMVSNVPGLYPLDASSIPPPSCDNAKPQILPSVFLETNLSLLESHSYRRRGQQMLGEASHLFHVLVYSFHFFPPHRQKVVVRSTTEEGKWT